jgi:hypothetical protein
MTGAALDTYEYIPRAVLECVATQLQVPAQYSIMPRWKAARE